MLPPQIKPDPFLWTEVWFSSFKNQPFLFQLPAFQERFPYLRSLGERLQQAIHEARQAAAPSMWPSPSTLAISPALLRSVESSAVWFETSQDAEAWAAQEKARIQAQGASSAQQAGGTKAIEKTGALSKGAGKDGKQEGGKKEGGFWSRLFGRREEAKGGGEAAKMPALRHSPVLQCMVEVEARPFLAEVDALLKALGEEELPPRYFFSPLLAAGTPLPLFSRRRIKTGTMEAGIDRCLINRDWDGIDRFDDLTGREEIEDLTGYYKIHRVSLRDYLGGALWRGREMAARRMEGEKLAFVVAVYRGDTEALSQRIAERAERWRELFGLSSYLPEHLEMASARLGGVMEGGEKYLSEIADIGAYLGEVMRAQLGGVYLSLPASCQALGDPAVALLMPFGAESYPIEKTLRAAKTGRKISLTLQADVQRSHQRQASLVSRLGRVLAEGTLIERRAALRLLAEIAETPVAHLFLERLRVEKEPDLLARMLDRLQDAPFEIDPQPILLLARHEADLVAARAIALLARDRVEALPLLLEELLAGGARIPLRPLARHALERYTEHHAKRILKSLGPIPLLGKEISLSFPPLPSPRKNCPILAEILELANERPELVEKALQILCAFSDLEEEEVLGTAIADPQLSLRESTLSLLVLTDDPLALHLLKGRRFFEEEPKLRMMILEALKASA